MDCLIFKPNFKHLSEYSALLKSWSTHLKIDQKIYCYLLVFSKFKIIFCFVGFWQLKLTRTSHCFYKLASLSFHCLFFFYFYQWISSSRLLKISVLLLKASLFVYFILFFSFRTSLRFCLPSWISLSRWKICWSAFFLYFLYRTLTLKNSNRTKRRTLLLMQNSGLLSSSFNMCFHLTPFLFSLYPILLSHSFVWFSGKFKFSTCSLFSLILK